MLIALIILLILIVISVFAYPLICAEIVIASKRFKGIVTGSLLLITIALYLFACTTLEDSFDDWCYSVYAGVVLTPIFLYIGNELEESGRKTAEKAQYNNITIQLLTFLTSTLFTIEGMLRMYHSNSAHRFLNYVWSNTDPDIYRFYHDEFQYAGNILFFVSLSSAFIIGCGLYRTCKEHRRKQAIEAEKQSRIEKENKEAYHSLKADSNLFMSFEPQQVDIALQYYNTFCQKIIIALESSDENKQYTFRRSAMNNHVSTYEVLLITNNLRSFYFYPTGIYFKTKEGSSKYIPNVNTTVSLRTEQIKMDQPLPYEVLPVSESWLHSCRDGSPDGRYIYNPKRYVYEFAYLNIAELILHIFSLKAARDVVIAYRKMYSFISQLKEQKNQEKKNPITKENATTSDIITKDKECITKIGQLEETKTAKLQVTIDNPKTLDECFSDIIHKRGTDILKDEKLVSIISSYKDVDISEYKDVLEEMVSSNFLYQFTEPRKLNDFVLFNLSSSFARQKKVNAQRVLYITQALVKALKRIS